MLVETHANLHHADFDDDITEVINRARLAKITTIVTICCHMDEFAPALSIAQSDPDIWCTIGVHPHHAAKHPDLSVAELVASAAHDKVIGIGETGLDYHYNYSPRADQIKNLMTHIEAARQTKLPLVLHTREADQDMGDILQRELALQPFRFVLHSYTSGAELARIGAEAGGYFSVNGISTFKNAAPVRDIIRDIMPDDRIMLETDCPYLAPIPHRGRRNEPAYLPLIRDHLADIKGWSANDTDQRTNDAFFQLFTKAKRP
ncbi:MAG: LuxR family transcriptional regulator [Robiginitomaculum sp.]|nr:MAG: LuxR family transcriptional regulator [Robiginitomaculum sp.]